MAGLRKMFDDKGASLALQRSAGRAEAERADVCRADLGSPLEQFLLLSPCCLLQRSLSTWPGAWRSRSGARGRRWALPTRYARGGGRQRFCSQCCCCCCCCCCRCCRCCAPCACCNVHAEMPWWCVLCTAVLFFSCWQALPLAHGGECGRCPHGARARAGGTAFSGSLPIGTWFV